MTYKCETLDRLLRSDSKGGEIEENPAVTECTAKEPTHIDDSTLNKQLFILTALLSLRKSLC